MNRAWRQAAALSLGTVLASLVCAAEPQPQRTLKDLEGRKVEVRSGEPAPASLENALENYRAFLELQSSDPALRAEALRRLADLNLEVSEIERAEREQIVAEGLGGPEAIRLYTLLLDSYPQHPSADAVLYQLARAHESNAQPEQALAALDRLAVRFPASRLIDEAQFRRGEILFGEKRYEEAQSAYAEVVRIGAGSPFFEQSLYKEGWSLFKLARSEESLRRFGELLDRKLIDPNPPRAPRAIVELAGLPRPERELIDDSLRVCSLMFSTLEGAHSAGEFLSSRGDPPYGWLVYARLGDLYLEKERYQDAAQAYEAFVARHPIDVNAPLLQVRAVEAYGKGGFASLVLAGKEQFVDGYGFGAPFWNGRQPEQFPAVVAELKTSVIELARHYHAEAQKSGRPADYGRAALRYRSYLEWFAEEPDSPQTRFLLAESLFEGGQFAAAASEYLRTAYEYPAHARAEEAGYAALLAYAEHESTLSGEERAAWHAEGLEQGLKFAATWPENPQAPVILTRAARESYEAKQFDRAVQIAETVLARQPAVDAGQRRVALTVIAHARFDQGRYAEAESAYQWLRAALPPDDPEQADIAEKLAAAVYKQAEAQQAAGEGSAAVDTFLRVAQVAPTAAAARNAQYDAAAALVNLQDWPRAIEVLQRFRSSYPEDPLAAEATRTLALAYAETQQPARAAAELERIADAAHPAADKQDGPAGSGPLSDEALEEGREALWRAAEFYAGAGDAVAAGRCYEKYLQRYAADFDRAIEVQQRLVEQAVAANDHDGRQRWSQALVATHEKAAAPTDRSRYLAAKASLALAEPLGAGFAAVQLRAPLPATLERKKESMELALQAYGRAAQYGVAEVTTAATHDMAELYRLLAQDLMSSQRPARLDADELEQYEILLEEQAFPFEEKAIEIHEANAARASQGVYDQWVNKSFAVLAQLQPARYAKSEPQAASLPDDAAGLAAREAELQQQLETDPNDAAAATRLGVLYRKLGRFEAARAAYERALDADPGHGPAMLSLGILHDLYLQEPQRALQAYEMYQQHIQSTQESHPQVAGWIVELRRRLGVESQPTEEGVSS